MKLSCDQEELVSRWLQGVKEHEEKSAHQDVHLVCDDGILACSSLIIVATKYVPTLTRSIRTLDKCSLCPQPTVVILSGFRSAAAKNLLAMLSFGETVFASNAEAKEFYSLASALGMDKADMGAKRMTENSQEEKEETGLEKQQQQQQHRHLRLQADHQVEMEIPDMISIEKEDNHKENQEKAGANEEEKGSEDKRKRKQPDISTKSQHMQGNNEETEEKYRELQSLIRKSRDGKGNTVRCPIPDCQVRYKNVNLIIQHMCGSHFRRELERGRKAELDIGRRECLLCGSVMSSLFNLTCHYGIIHRDVVSLAWDRIAKPRPPWFLQEEEEEEAEAEPKEADPEEEIKKEKMERLKKLCKSSSSSGFSCFLCDSSGTFRTPPHLLSHLARLHFRQRLRDMIKNAQDEAGSVGRFDCGQCGEKLCSSSSLLNHCGVVHGWVVGLALEEERVMEKQQQQRQQQQQQHEQGGEVPVRGRQQLQQQKQQGQQQLQQQPQQQERQASKRPAVEGAPKDLQAEYDESSSMPQKLGRAF